MAVSITNIMGNFGNDVSVNGGDIVWLPLPTALLSSERGEELRIFLSVTFHASASGNAVLHTKKSAETTEGTFSKEITVSAGNTVVVEYPILTPFQYFAIGIKNEDVEPTNTLVFSARFEGKKLTGL